MDFDEVLRTLEDSCAKQKADDFSDDGCHVVWDGFMCWPRSPANFSVYLQCPAYLVPGTHDAHRVHGPVGFQKYARKLCTEDGWEMVELNKSLQDYCSYSPEEPLPPFEDSAGNLVIFPWLPVIKVISVVGYGVSLVTLLLAFVILAFSKRLRCQRNFLHLHLFVSFIMRAFMVLLKEYLFVGGVGFASNAYIVNGTVVYIREVHTWECKVFTVLWQYFLMANYSWILMEGIYLHNLIFRALFSDTSSIRWHVILGWTLPVFAVVPWAAVRKLYEDIYCWTSHSSSLFLIIRIPMVASCVINLFLFINITRVLLVKLNSSASQLLDRKISRYRKWAKSTLVLMPLYGVHYVLFLSLSYFDNPYVELAWLFLDHTFSSTQGFCVGMLYCILNGDVIAEMKSRWHQIKAWYNADDELNLSSLRKYSSNTAAGSVAVGQIQVTGC